ncbi:hypothetical protein [Vibrio neptunius]|uniref:Uncharacterized protein n=1 Tax=Vibrio neptunius TaxID=170651 RepID=A0ABS3A8B6_9VIBR|nr:hypothetical protein [Vibrio neptunius]MBN3495709.1 hypothetical protein [Vibrio neptunius]MBN3518199.1 hypothetical protein [Vibrio neptunius]MBN3552483.1 hypothetical protein [Vibrio neptunius]MBN3580593.1 hypothetical protein [Vibrio neptunius]MCH9874259.1 hypothetical protein [Vibrio neptunius]
MRILIQALPSTSAGDLQTNQMVRPSIPLKSTVSMTGKVAIMNSTQSIGIDLAIHVLHLACYDR